MRKISSSENQRCRSVFSAPADAEVVAERLLDDHARPAAPLAPLADLLDDRLERLRRHGEVVDAVPLGAVAHVARVQLARRPSPRRSSSRTRSRCSAGAARASPRRPGGTGRGRSPSPPASSTRGTARSSAASGRPRRRRTVRAAAGGTRAHTAPGRASAGSDRRTRRRSRARTDPACAGAGDPRSGDSPLFRSGAGKAGTSAIARLRRAYAAHAADARPPRLASIPASSSRKESANFSTPSASSVSVTSS